jgi:hypothetical protein
VAPTRQSIDDQSYPLRHTLRLYTWKNPTELADLIAANLGCFAVEEGMSVLRSAGFYAFDGDHGEPAPDGEYDNLRTQKPAFVVRFKSGHFDQRGVVESDRLELESWVSENCPIERTIKLYGHADSKGNGSNKNVVGMSWQRVIAIYRYLNDEKDTRGCRYRVAERILGFGNIYRKIVNGHEDPDKSRRVEAFFLP